MNGQHNCKVNVTIATNLRVKVTSGKFFPVKCLVMLQATLTILVTTDLHAHAFGWDYHADCPRPGVGLADLAHMIDAARRDCPNVLLLDNGDFLQGSALGDWAAEVGGGTVHPMVSAMNALGYDAVNLGNHEFSHGLPMLRKAIADADFPMLSANLAFACKPPPVRTAVLLERVMSDGKGGTRPITIGVTGIAPRQTTTWEAAQIDGRVTAREAVPAATQAVAALREAGADLVILLAHTGWSEEAGAEEGAEEAENLAHPLLRDAGADAVILGHMHRVYPAPEEEGRAVDGMPGKLPGGLAGGLPGPPAVMPGFFGSHLGRIDLSLRHDGRAWRLGATRAEAVAARPAAAEHPGMERACRAEHEAARDWLDGRIGACGDHLHSYFARIYPSALVRLIAAAQADHARRAMRGSAWEDLPLLSAAAPFRAGGRGGAANFTDIPAGDLQLRHAADLYPFPNSIVALLLTGAELADWLERAVIQFATLVPGQDEAALLVGGSPSFDFDMIDDLAFCIDLTQPPRFDSTGRQIGEGRRIGGLRYQGQRIGDGDRFIVTTNSFRAAGSGGFAGCRKERVVLDDRVPTRAVLAGYLAAGAGRAGGERITWGYAPAGASAFFDSAEKSVGCMDEIAALQPEAVAGAEPGWQRFRLRL